MTETRVSAVEQIIAAALEHAVAFVEEFREPLIAAETDWDAEAWGQTVSDLGLSPEQQDAWWPVYQAVLVARTRELSEQS